MNKSKKTLNIQKFKIDKLFINGGIIIIIIATVLKLYSIYEKNRLISDYETLQICNGENTENIHTEYESNDESPLEKNILGIIEIPKINLKAPIGQGVDKETLKYSVGHFESTSIPGKKGNCCLIGHRSYTYGEFFNRLDELEKDDTVIINCNNNKYTYIISDKFVVNSDDTYVLDNNDAYELTLITCTPIRVGTHRLIIKGILKN